MSKENKVQVKPKLKIKVNFKGEDHTINEYDLAGMISDLNVKVMHLAQAINGITSGMKAATEGVELDQKIKQRTAPLNMASGPITTEEYLATGSIGSISPPTIPSIKLPKLES